MLRDKAIPLYYQLETILRKKIISGDFAPDTALPGEEMLAANYQVSRATVRQALSALEKENYVVRQRGKGTFVSDKINKLDMPKFSGSIEDLILMGKLTRTKVLDIRWINPPEKIKAYLDVKDSKKVLRIEKVRQIEGSPFSHVYNYLPRDIGEKLPTDMTEMVASKPMLTILEDELGIRPVEADQSVKATIADSEVASLLEIRVGDPLLKTERTIYDNRSKPVEFVSALYRADQYAYTMKLKRNRTQEAVVWDTV